VKNDGVTASYRRQLESAVTAFMARKREDVGYTRWHGLRNAVDMANEQEPHEQEKESPSTESVLSGYAETIGNAVGVVAQQAAALKDQGARVVEQLSSLVEDAQPAMNQLKRQVEDRFNALRGQKTAAPVMPLQPAPLSKRQRRKRAVMSPEAKARLAEKEAKRQERWRQTQQR
jgi:hypothetical protein